MDSLAPPDGIGAVTATLNGSTPFLRARIRADTCLVAKQRRRGEQCGHNDVADFI